MTVFMGTTKIDPQKTIGEISSVLVKAGANHIATAGMTQAHEVFMPYAVIPGTNDQTMFQAWEANQKALPAPSQQ